MKAAEVARGARVDAARARLDQPGAGSTGETGVEGLPGSVVNLSSGSPERSASDPEDRLAKLADLKERGFLSGEEFAAAKAKILGA